MKRILGLTLVAFLLVSVLAKEIDGVNRELKNKEKKNNPNMPRDHKGDLFDMADRDPRDKNGDGKGKANQAEVKVLGLEKASEAFAKIMPPMHFDMVKRSVILSTDKPVYQPNDVVFMEALVFNALNKTVDFMETIDVRMKVSSLMLTSLRSWILPTPRF
jgi:hypothetical protein